MIPFARNTIPSADVVESILMINSCTWPKALMVEEWLKFRFPSAHITHVLRELYPFSYGGKDLIISTAATSISKKMKVISALRTKMFDVVVVCWTNEESFNSMKALAFFVHGKTYLAFNENHDCFWLSRDNVKIVVGHAKWRLRQRIKVLRARRTLLNLFPMIFLAPFGLLYVLIRTMYYTAKKYLLRRTPARRSPTRRTTL